MPYAMYLRKSRADAEAELHGAGETLARHRATLTALAERNRHAIGQVYAEVVSGETIRARPQMQQLLADVAAGKWEGVYCMEVERLSRGDTMDQGRVAETFTISQTAIITPAKTYRPENDYDVEYFEFSLFMSRREYKTINRRIQAGRMYSLREGKWICSTAPYGYRRIKVADGKGYTLAPQEDEAKIVREIHEMYQRTDMGIVRLADWLGRTGAPRGEKDLTWTNVRVYRILTMKVYLGLVTWGKSRMVPKLTDSGYVKERTPGEEVTYQGLHPALITQECYDATQRKLVRPRSIPKNDGRVSNPLRGIIFCGECGHVLSALPDCGRQPASVYCHTKGCPTVKNYREPVERAILDTLRDWLETGIVTVDGQPIYEPQNTQRAALDRLAAEREKILAQQSRLQDLVEQSVYTIEQYQERYAILRARLQEIDASIQQLRADQQVQYATPQELEPALRRCLELYHASDPKQQSELLRGCVSKIIYRKTVRGNGKGKVVRVDPNQFHLEIYPRICEE